MWVFWAVIASLTYCISLEINKNYQFDGLILVFWRSCLASVYLAFLFPFMYWPSNPVYYLVVFLMSAVSVFCMMVQFNMAAKHNGRIANLQQPITTILSFLIWLTIDTVEWERVSTDYIYSGGVFLSFVLMIISLQFIRKNDASWSAFITILPVGVLYAVFTVLTKLMLDLDDADTLGIALNWVWLGNVLMALVAFPVLMHKHKSYLNFKPEGILYPALAGSLVHSISWLAMSVSTISTPNPAYPGVIAALSPIWFTLYYKSRGIKDEISPIAGLGLTVSAIILLIVTL